MRTDIVDEHDPRVLTVETLRRMRLTPYSMPCAIRGCRNAGSIGDGVMGNSIWLCWNHHVEMMQTEEAAR